MSGQLHKSEVLISSTLLLVKTKNISEHKKKAHNDGNSSAFKQSSAFIFHEYIL